MRIGIAKEVAAYETRVAATPETVKKLVSGGHSVVVQSDAGRLSAIPDQHYIDAGATVVATAAEAFDADIVLKVRAPEAVEIPQIKSGALVLGLFHIYTNTLLPELAAHQLSCFAMELTPRTTRAQSMDVLSSQANIGGYKAVLLASQYYPRFFPMLMTAAGTVKPARVLIMGAGVAGLQAIATAKRLGAVVEAFDVRPVAKEQVESLGAKFVEVPLTDEEKKSAETAGGYAREMSEDYKRRQAELVDKHARNADIIITTALIPGRPAPVLIQSETVGKMKAGSVIIDMAVEQGGNCPLSRLNEVYTTDNGVTLVGIANLPGLVAADASALYARNLLTFLGLLLDKEGKIVLNREDDIIAATLVTHGGEVLFKRPN
ncbi:Re/Si-specific NAD(P)(+) transhydrogenase subunit alpha [Parachitinimonas caeni]|uniref:proton-translocating NAD(P)(+) transhydrogenase n=1 Tax=Parachitinimonas caeni TaxID=3031301 RepID=A0ABT7DU48_9NEIS|nr:Re/Si-specific NAD(P)(+) transhydrogenase subunit alpha [Parachitinimonas caeni]MDK2122635.1 Re/Si-specific NAD(P)(+) transhydrogenase subunit alpha [Parachitinimonas caeni]